MENIRAGIYEIVAGGHPMTVRQVFYQLSNRGLIDKTEAEYKQTVIRLLGTMRLDGDLPFAWIADNSRWMRKPDTHSSLKNMLDITASAYRRALWDDQHVYVEIWLEKEALSGVVYPVTSKWDVPLMVTRGYPSLTFLHDAGDILGCEDREVYLYYFGDWDPSGLDIARNVQERLEEFSNNADINFERIAVTPEQVHQWSLPTRPTKKTDSRSRSFEGASVELDAIPPHELRGLVDECIVRHIDTDIYNKTLTAEASERELLQNWDRVLSNISPDP